MPGIEPRVADVGDPRDRLAARRAGDPDRVHERPVRRVALERVPALDRAPLELLATADDVERAARAAVVDRQREAVVALLGDHPVAHVQQPVELALVAERRDPPDPVDALHDLVAEAGVDLRLGQRLARLVVDLAHADVPLVDEPEQQRRPAPPAVRVAVAVRLEVVEEPPPLEVVDDRLGDCRRLAPAEPAEVRVVAPVLVDRPDDRQPERRARAGSPRRRSPGRCGRCRSPPPRRRRSRRRRGARSRPRRTRRAPPAGRRTAPRSASRRGPRRRPPRRPGTGPGGPA